MRREPKNKRERSELLGRTCKTRSGSESTSASSGKTEHKAEAGVEEGDTSESSEGCKKKRASCWGGERETTDAGDMTDRRPAEFIRLLDRVRQRVNEESWSAGAGVLELQAEL